MIDKYENGLSRRKISGKSNRLSSSVRYLTGECWDSS